MHTKLLSKQTEVLLPIFGVISIVLFWQWALPFFWRSQIHLAPTPTQIIEMIVKKWPMLLDNFTPTFIEALTGFIFGNLVAVLLAIVFAYSRFIRLTYFPAVLFFNTIPILALSPIIVLIFGLRITTQNYYCSGYMFFPYLG